MIFDCYERTDCSPSTYSESAYHFFDRHNSAAASRIRAELERWTLKYPAEFRDQLCGRFRTEFEAAFFELLLHELFIRQNATVRVHPQAGDRGKRPDFEIALPGSMQTLVLEAVVCFDEATELWLPRLKFVFDMINGIDCRDFFILIKEAIAKSPESPPTRRIASELTSRLHQIEIGRSLSSAEVGEVMTDFLYEDDTVRLLFEIRRKHGARDRRQTQNIGMLPVVSKWGDSTHAIRRSLNAKAKRYGKLDKPFVIALNAIADWPQDEHERRQSLFGTRRDYVEAFTGQLQTKVLDDGFWGSAVHPKWTRVSAVILGRVFETNLPWARLCLYHNPWARHPLPPDAWPLPIAIMRDGRVVYENSDSKLADVLRLPADWPGNLFTD